jgi:hypothetical protein
MSRNKPSLGYFGAAALGSMIVALLLSYQWAVPGETRLATVAPAPPEMMRLLRDEHGLVADMLKVQIANGKW